MMSKSQKQKQSCAKICDGTCRHSTSIVYEFIKVLFILYSLAPREREWVCV